MPSHPIWWSVVWACVAWYSIVTLYVSWKGLGDIRSMLARLHALRDREPAATSSSEDGGNGERT